MTGVKRIFFDTTPFIYLVENHPEYSEIVANFLSETLIVKESNLYTSVITIAEFEVKPKRKNQLSVIEKFKNKLIQFDCNIIEVNLEIAEISSDLRSKYLFLKSLDALQIATAIFSKCQYFYTNDFKLKEIKEIEVTLISQTI